MAGEERLRLYSERRPVTPQWSIQPREHEHAPKGHPPFEILFIPEIPEIIPLQDVFFNQEGSPRKTDRVSLEERIQFSVQNQVRRTEEFNTNLRRELKAQGLSEEEIQTRMRKFFNNKLARLHPEEIFFRGGNLFARLGETDYFTYAASRDRQTFLEHGYDRLGLALAVCTLAIVPSNDGSQKILYTIRGTANESYPGWYHTVGGTVQTVINGIANPNAAINREIREELGLEPEEFEVEGIMGSIMNNFDLHPEILYATRIQIPLEEWLGKRQTDREVDVAYFSDTPVNLAAFILGQKTPEFSDACPIVPPGLCSYLFYGRIKYGEDWYKEVYKRIPQY